MRQDADRRLAQEFVAEALGERRRGYDTPLFIRDEMANGWHPAEQARALAGLNRNQIYLRPVIDPPPALPAELWDRLTPPLFDLTVCPECDGSGYGYDDSQTWTCPGCNGDGAVAKPREMEPPND